MTDKIYFIWTQGLCGATPGILHGLEQNKDSHNRERKTILQKHELVPEYKDLSLNQLSLIFPYKGVDANEKEAKA